MHALLWLFLLLPYAADWPMFRGPNASGVSSETGLPVEFGPAKNVLWKTLLPPGHSSPSLAGDKIFLTAHERPRATPPSGGEGSIQPARSVKPSRNGEADKLYVLALNRATGRLLWRREVPRPRTERLHQANGPASPTPASDGRNVYAFFTDFGLISFGPDGEERWRLPLGPFNTPMGMSASPVLAGNTLLQICDQESGSYFLAVDKDTGKLKWRVERPEYTRGFSTPVLYQPPDGPLQVVIAGSYQLTAYQVETGEPVWWVSGLTWQLKPTPVMDGANIYVLGWAGEADPGQQEAIPPFEEVCARFDANQDGRLARDEVAEPRVVKRWGELDLDLDGFLGERDWKMYQNKRAVVNAVQAFRLGGRGDMTEKSQLWKYHKSLPNVPSPLLYQGVLYLMKEGGILTTLDAKTGAMLKQARLAGAPGAYFSSPVGADGKVYTVSEEGKMTVLKAGGEWEILAVNDLEAGSHSTPAIADGRLYVRTHDALYCFAEKERIAKKDEQ